MKTKRKSTRRTRKQRGGVGDEEILRQLIEITSRYQDFKSISNELYINNDQKPEYNLSREKWIDILKQLFKRNGIQITFDFNNVLSRSVLSYYERQSRCPGPGCVDPDFGHMYLEAIPKAVYEMSSDVPRAVDKMASADKIEDLSPVQRLEQYLDFAYENLKGIVKDKINQGISLLFSKICAEVLKITKGIRPGNADFVVLPHQWRYLLIRLYNHAHSSVILDSGLPPEITRDIKDYYERMDRQGSHKKIMAEAESSSREEALTMKSVAIRPDPMAEEDHRRIEATHEALERAAAERARIANERSAAERARIANERAAAAALFAARHYDPIEGATWFRGKSDNSSY